MLQRIKPVIWLLLTLILGFLLGVSSSRYMFQQRVKDLRGQERGKGFVKLHHNVLEIRPDQKAIIDPILQSYFERLEAHHRSTRIIMDSMHQDLRPHLDDRQISRLDSMKSRFRRRGPRRRPPGRPFNRP